MTTPAYEQAAMVLIALQERHNAQAQDPRHPQMMGHPAYRSAYFRTAQALAELEATTDELMMREGAGQ